MSANRDDANIELHINELVLHGFARVDRQRIGEAVQQELLRQLSEQGIPHTQMQQGRVLQLDAKPIQTQVGSRAETIGRQVAQTVYGSVAGEQSRRGGLTSSRLKSTNLSSDS